MPRKTGLGRGLDALIPVSESVQNEADAATVARGGVVQLAMDSIVPNPRQPRTYFDPEGLAELAASIREHGIIQPLLVTSGAQPGHMEDRPGETEHLYTLIAGERRWLAARQAGLATVPAIVREASLQELVELALIENVQRADLSPLEAAEAYRQLAEEFHLSHEAIAVRVGKSRVAVTNTLRLLKLPQIVQKAIAEGKVSEGHARALLALPTPQAQAAALQTILAHELNVRQTEDLVRKLTGEKPFHPPKPAAPPEIAALEDRLRERLGTKVTLNRSRKGGTVVIHYYSDEELDALVVRIVGDDPA